MNLLVPGQASVAVAGFYPGLGSQTCWPASLSFRVVLGLGFTAAQGLGFRGGGGLAFGLFFLPCKPTKWSLNMQFEYRARRALEHWLSDSS